MKAIQRPDGSIEWDGTPDELRSVLAPIVVAKHAERSGHVRKTTAINDSPLADQIREFFASSGDKVLAMKDVTDALPTVDSTTVSSAVNRMSKAKNATFVRVAHGKYKAVQKTT